MTETEQAQAFLIGRGYSVGSAMADGIYGRNTIRAVKSWQRSNGLNVSGNLDVPTLKSMGIFVETVPNDFPLDPPWFELGVSKKGLHENRNRSELMRFLRSDGRTLGDPARLPWCGDFVETCLAVTLPNEPLPSNPYLARNWSRFGRQCQPTTGAVLVFWRGKKSGISGHVGFYVGETASTYLVLGGNQSNRISFVNISKGRLLSIRWPSTFPLPSGGSVMADSNGAISTNEA